MKGQSVRCCRLKLGLGGLCVALIAGSVVVSVVPQWVVWYVQANASTRAVSRDLVGEIANKVMVALEMTISQAEQITSEIALIAQSSPGACSDDYNVSGAVVQGRWRDYFNKVSVPERSGWAIIAADRFGSTVCTFGNPPMLQSKAIPGVPMYVNDVVVNTANGTIDLGKLQSTTPSFTVFTRPWFSAAVASPGRMVWGRFYIGIPSGMQIIAVSKTHGSLREPNRTCGVRGVIMSVTGWQQFMRAQQVGKTGHVWLIEADTMLLFSTTRNTSLFVGSTAQRVFARNSTDAMTRDVGRYVEGLTSGGRTLSQDFGTATIGGRPCQVLVSLEEIHPETGFAPMYYVVAIPVDDYWGAINRGVVVTITITVVLFVSSLAVAIVAGLVFVSRPLIRTSKTISRLSCLNMEDLAAVSGHHVVAPRLAVPKSRSEIDVVGTVQTGQNCIEEGSSSIAGFGGSHLLAEVSDLLVSASKMAESLYAVGRYVSMDLCSWIIENRVVEMPLAPKTITALFCDIQGSTAMIDRSKREGTMAEFGRMLNEVLTTLANVAKRHGGYIDKLMGDEVMAVFNAPYECRDHQLRACSAALGMRDAVAELCRSWDELGLYRSFERPRVRIGVAAGEVLVGDIGAFGTLTNFTAIGDTVCIASRLQSAAKALDPEGTGILLTGETWEAASTQMGACELVVRTVGCIKLRGPDLPMLVSTIVGRRSGVDDGELQTMRAYDRAMQAYNRYEWAECIESLRAVVAAQQGSSAVLRDAERVLLAAENNIENPCEASNVTHDLSGDASKAALRPWPLLLVCLDTAVVDEGRLRALLAMGSDPNERTASGDVSAAYLAAAHASHRALRALLDAAHRLRTELDISAVAPGGGMPAMTPLHAAALAGSLECAVLLVDELGCDANAEDAWGRTALHAAVESSACNVVLVAWLLARGAVIARPLSAVGYAVLPQRDVGDPSAEALGIYRSFCSADLDCTDAVAVVGTAREAGTLYASRPVLEKLEYFRAALAGGAKAGAHSQSRVEVPLGRRSLAALVRWLHSDRLPAMDVEDAAELFVACRGWACGEQGHRLHMDALQAMARAFSRAASQGRVDELVCVAGQMLEGFLLAKGASVLLREERLLFCVFALQVVYREEILHGRELVPFVASLLQACWERDLEVQQAGAQVEREIREWNARFLGAPASPQTMFADHVADSPTPTQAGSWTDLTGMRYLGKTVRIAGGVLTFWK
eukprot:m51a1_g7629 hypothetical protein (1224) ;mRNA; r:315272-319783